MSDLMGQILTALTLPGVPSETKRLNIHFARMGEPTWNPAVLDCGKWIADHLGDSYHPHPVVSTMMPRHNHWLKTFTHTWMRLKNRVFRGNAGLQISINSTDEVERRLMFNDNALSLADIAETMRGVVPVGRKVTLNFAVADYTVDPDELLRYFPPEWYVCKLTPMHKTEAAVGTGIRTAGEYTEPEPYLELEAKLRAAGYDVLVFIASREEDASRITCGNAVLSGALPDRYARADSGQGEG